MNLPNSSSLLDKMADRNSKCTPLERQLAGFLLSNPKEAIFMSARELARKNDVSLSTVVRFVRQLGYSNYREFSRDMREQIDIRMTLPDRVEVQKAGSNLRDRIEREISDEIDNLKILKNDLDLEFLGKLSERIWQAPQICVVGARMSLSMSTYFSWALSRIRSQITSLDGGNRNSLDWIALSPKDTLVIILTVMRYPNDLFRLARFVHEQGRDLLVIADSRNCPLFQFADHCLSVPCRHFPIVGSPSALGCILNCIVYAMIFSHSEEVREHQNALEQLYRESEIFFDPGARSRISGDINAR
jgi:DNA-binding MurR/RpiR family transcriptional regulator